MSDPGTATPFEERFQLLVASGQANERSVATARLALARVESHYEVRLSEEQGAALATHLAITLKRLLNGEGLSRAPDAVWQELEEHPEELALAMAIVRDLEQALGQAIAPDEAGFVGLHLAAMRTRIEAERAGYPGGGALARIMTVLGPCAPGELGVTSSHEHLFAESTSDRRDPDTRLDEFDPAVEELIAFKQAGGEALVEVTTIDMGRDVRRLAAASAASGVKIVAATGFYKGNYAPDGGQPRRSWPFLPEDLRAGGVERLAGLFRSEVRDGVDGTEVRVGIIGEVGTSHHQILPEEEMVLRAAARANRETGVPIATHTTLGTMGREQVRILVEGGADPGHVVLCHMDLVADSAYHRELAREGVFLGFDTAGKERYQSDATRVGLIRALVDAGYEDQVVLACDIGRRSQRVRYGGHGHAYLLTHFVPRLEAAGLPRATIEKFLVHNPRRLLAF